MAGLGDDEITSSTHHAYGFLFDQSLVRERIVGIDAHHATLGFRHDLLRHDQHVAVEQGTVGFGATRIDDHVAELHAGRDLPDADDPPRRHAQGRGSRSGIGTHRRFLSVIAATVVRASERETSGDDMIVSVTTQRTPSRSTSATRSASRVSMTSVEQMGA